MAGIFGNSGEDIYREKQLDNYLESMQTTEQEEAIEQFKVDVSELSSGIDNLERLGVISSEDADTLEHYIDELKEELQFFIDNKK